MDMAIPTHGSSSIDHPFGSRESKFTYRVAPPNNSLLTLKDNLSRVDRAHPTPPSDSANKIAKYHPKHNDPLADVVLVSNNKVAFRVHRYYLKLNSVFASDMFSIPTVKATPRGSTSDSASPSSPSSVTSGTSDLILESPDLVLEVDVDDLTLQIYVNYLLTSPEGLPARKWTVLQLIDFERLCEQMQTLGMEEHIRQGISMSVMDNPWLVFTYAAQKNNLQLAKSAISHFKYQPTSPPELWPDVPFKHFANLPPEWTYNLFRLRGRPFKQDSPLMLTKPGLTPWRIVAREFMSNAAANDKETESFTDDLKSV